MPVIEIDGRTYELVERHRPRDKNDSRIYKGFDSFVRVGPAAVIDANLAVHRRLENAGFPVPHILQEGSTGDERYFIEESLGEQILRLQFADEVKVSRQISEPSFDSFVEVIHRYLDAQAKTRLPRDTNEFLDRMHVVRLCKELPTFASKIQEKTTQHLEAISQFPFVLSHGDLSPNNMLPKGIIDLEDTLPAPFGYDAVSALMTYEWFPEDGDFEFPITFYDFTEKQKAKYLAMCDEVSANNSFPRISDHLKDFDFFRAVWLTEGMAEWPKSKKYRNERFIKEYLN
jgi:thiamine kinase-like enzyme